MSAHFHNPTTMHAPRGYTHVVETTGPARTIYLSGQVGIAPDGNIAGDFRAQVEQSFKRRCIHFERMRKLVHYGPPLGFRFHSGGQQRVAA